MSSDEDSDFLIGIHLLWAKYTLAGERPNQDVLEMDDAEYHQYTSLPLVKEISQTDYKLHLAHVSYEFMASACFLPSESESIFNDPIRIQRYQFIGKKDGWRLPEWHFHGIFGHGHHIYRFKVEEIDTGNVDYNYERMAKKMYVLHYFKHDNLMAAYFTLPEPWIFRMNIATRNTVSLMKVSNHLNVQGNNQCPSIKYVAICILRALAYLHDSNIVHHGVKIENCFLDFDGNVLLGEFQYTDVCNQEFEKTYEIWNVGTCILDYCFNTNDYRERYPDPTCIEGYPNLFDKMLRLNNAILLLPEPVPDEIFAFDLVGNGNGIGNEEVDANAEAMDANAEAMDANDNDPANIHFTPMDHKSIHDFATEEMYGFLCRVFQNDFVPSAATLLENDQFVEFDDFEQLKSQMVRRCQDLGNKPFCENVQVSTLNENFKPLDVWKEKSRNHFVYKTISPSIYQSQLQDRGYQFKIGSEIRVDFTIISQIYDGSYTFNEVFKVGDEGSIFKTLFNLLKDVDANSVAPKILQENGASRWWYPIRYPRRFFYAWEIFTLRAALDGLLADAANCTCDPFGTRTRQFPLCHHKKDISRHVVIEIHYSRADVEIKQ